MLHLLPLLCAGNTCVGDSGPIYAETDVSRFIVEPFNAVSAAIFVLIPLYWFLRVGGEYRRHLFVTVALPFLLIGGVGGTLYHAFRSSEVWLLMDWLPIALLSLAASGYFLTKVLGSWRKALLIIFGVFVLQGALMYSAGKWQLVPPHIAVNANYAMLGAVILAPLVWLLVKTKFRNAAFPALALAAFAAALFCRIADRWDPLMIGQYTAGTHFLWHVFGALACNFILAYLYRLNAPPPEKQPRREAPARRRVPVRADS